MLGILGLSVHYITDFLQGTGDAVILIFADLQDPPDINYRFSPKMGTGLSSCQRNQNIKPRKPASI
jgi:hypothetical protein